MSAPFLRIEVYDPVNDEILVFLTNHLEWGATTIASLYKDLCKLNSFLRP